MFRSSKMLSLRSRYFKADTNGSIPAMFALTTVVLFAFVGISITYSDAVEKRTAAAAALDSAVLAGAMLPSGATSSERIAAANTFFAGNIAKLSPLSVSPSFSVDKNTVSGYAEVVLPATLKGFLRVETVTIGVHAAATKNDLAPFCVLGLNSADSGSFDQNGNASFDATNCAAQFNSTDKTGMHQVGTPVAKARYFGVSGNAHGNSFTPPPEAGSAKINDPYANVPFPFIGTCINLGPVKQTTVTLNPGTYCGGIDVQSGGTVNLNPGIYVMKDGNLHIQSGGTVLGNEVMIAFTGVDHLWASTLSMLGGAVLKVTSPVTGTYANMQFYGNRDVGTKESWVSIGGSGGAASTLEYDGVMYFPTQNVWIFGGTNVIGKSPTWTIVAQKLWVQDHSIVTVTQVNTRNLTGIGAPAMAQTSARLVQ